MIDSHGARTRSSGQAANPATPRRSVLALRLAAAFTQCALATAWADSGSGVDTSLGHALNPAGTSVVRNDPAGLGLVAHSRNPTGLMVAAPREWREPVRSDSGWLGSGSVELGGIRLGGDRRAAKFVEYKPLESGPALQHLRLSAEKPDEALYLELTGGALGRDDQYLGVTAGRYNAWRLKAFYNETSHVFTSTYRNLWTGTGSGTLTLASLPAAPGAPATAASTDIAIGAAALATPESTLGLVRRKGGLRLEATLPAQWKAFAAYSLERREGARPFGMVSGGGGGTGGVEIPESVDYDTHELLAGAQWSSARTSVNLQASASLFRNNVDTLTVANPLFLPAANGIARFPNAVFDLAPDNEQYNLKAEAAHLLPEFYRARFTGVVSATRSRQNDALIPSTPYAGASVNGVAGGAWDTLASLSQPTANARIDSTLLDLGLSLNPVNGLDVRAKLRRYDTRNASGYLACNPLTGQLGRLINDGTAAVFATPGTVAGENPAGTSPRAYDALLCNLTAVRALGLTPNAGNVPLRSVPYEHRQQTASLGAEYRLARGQSLSTTLERDTFHRAFRERERTEEDRVKLGYVNRAMAGGTLRVSLEEARRRGSPYVVDPYQDFHSISLGPLPDAATTNVATWLHLNDQHRRFELADRDRTLVNLRWNHAVREDMDLAVSAQWRDQRYPDSPYGRNGHERQGSFNLDLNWQPTPQTQAYAFASHQDGLMQQSGVQQNTCNLGATYYFYSDGSVNTTGTLTPAQVAAGIGVVANSGVVTGANFTALCGSASATSPLYPASRAWSATQADRSTVLGVGWKQEIGTMLLDLHYTSTRTRTTIGYTYNAAALGLVTSGAPSAAQLATLALIGSGFPDLLFRQNVIDASLQVPVRKDIHLRLIARHETGRLRDWHYDGVAANPTPSNNQQTYLDGGPQVYRASLMGAFVQIRW